MDIIQSIASQLNISAKNVKETVVLLEADNTIPFIARYRKEVTGNLDEVQIRDINEALKRLKKLEERRSTILESISEQGKLTRELKSALLKAETLTQLEDLYLPYRPKRRTRASIARKKGLENLSKMIAQQLITDSTLIELVQPFLNKEVTSVDQAISGAMDIVAEMIADHANIRESIRREAMKKGRITSEKTDEADDERETFSLYYQFEIPIKALTPHQILALNRGEKEKVLRVHLQIPEKIWRLAIRSQFPPDRRSVFFEALNQATDDAAKRLLLPAIERDCRRILAEKAESHAIDVFAKNLKALLTQPPLTGYTILAVDPGFRTGSKVVVLNPTGQLLEKTTIYPHPPQNKKKEAIQTLQKLIKKYKASLIVIGNGTASRETELLAAEITKSNPGLHYLITSEAGASVYSASDIAREEFPDLDVSIRGAVSIGRRVQDPLAELVKIDPRSIGVGLYQHDIDQSKLSSALDSVVESVVNAVGVDINTASAALLTHVAGIGPSLAKKIVEHRVENGRFETIESITEIAGLGPKSFEQSAGFLRIRNGHNPLDATAIHPESYPIAAKIIKKMDLDPNISSKDRIEKVNAYMQTADLTAIAKELGTGLLTLKDILSEIARPGRDPREDLPKPLLRQDVLRMGDLTQGMVLKGTIRNVVDFGAFVDIGVKTEGLLHQSKIARNTRLKVGDIITVKILSVDLDRKRISLGMQERENE